MNTIREGRLDRSVDQRGWKPRLYRRVLQQWPLAWTVRTQSLSPFLTLFLSLLIIHDPHRLEKLVRPGSTVSWLCPGERERDFQKRIYRLASLLDEGFSHGSIWITRRGEELFFSKDFFTSSRGLARALAREMCFSPTFERRLSRKFRVVYDWFARRERAESWDKQSSRYDYIWFER